MDNKSIASHFKLFADLLKLKGESPFRIRSYSSAYDSLRKFPSALCDMSKSDLLKIDGVGKAIADKIVTLCTDGELPQLSALKKEIPEGVQEMLNIRGLGITKILLLWKEKSIDTIEQLKEHCEDKSILAWKGFGEKTRVKLLREIEFYLENKGKSLYAQAVQLHEAILEQNPELKDRIRLTGDIRRKMPVVSDISWLMEARTKDICGSLHGLKSMEEKRDYRVLQFDKIPIPIHVYFATDEEMGQKLYETTGGKLPGMLDVPWQGDEEKTFAEAGLPYIIPEMRDLNREEILQALEIEGDFLRAEDIRGVIHAHTEWSDGKNSLIEMVEAAIDKGYEYLSITDHSKAAFYADGLDEKKLDAQMREIEKTRELYPDFTILSGVECDILNDGQMDLSDECLSELDIVIASVHSNLSMDKNHAMERLLAAIEHPHVDILGHLSGRLLLSRSGYELDYEEIIKACATHKVAIEINANPLRLDIDWRFIPLCRTYGVPLCVNPDAHNVHQIDLIEYGVYAGRKGGLKATECLNTLPVENFLTHFS